MKQMVAVSSQVYPKGWIQEIPVYASESGFAKFDQLGKRRVVLFVPFDASYAFDEKNAPVINGNPEENYEIFIMKRKAEIFGDQQALQQLKALDKTSVTAARDARNIGKKVSNYVDKTWKAELPKEFKSFAEAVVQKHQGVFQELFALSSDTLIIHDSPAPWGVGNALSLIKDQLIFYADIYMQLSDDCGEDYNIFGKQIDLVRTSFLAPPAAAVKTNLSRHGDSDEEEIGNGDSKSMSDIDSFFSTHPAPEPAEAEAKKKAPAFEARILIPEISALDAICSYQKKSRQEMLIPVVVEISAKDEPAKISKPSGTFCYVCVVDCSSSMMGMGASTMKAALKRMVGSFEIGSSFILLAFNNSADAVVPYIEIKDQSDIQRIQAAIGRLQCRGGTNFHAALKLLGETCAGLPKKWIGQTRVFWMTDGENTVGEFSSIPVNRAVRGLAEAMNAAAYRVNTEYAMPRLTIAGMGSSYQTDFLTQMNDVIGQLTLHLESDSEEQVGRMLEYSMEYSSSIRIQDLVIKDPSLHFQQAAESALKPINDKPGLYSLPPVTEFSSRALAFMNATSFVKFVKGEFQFEVTNALSGEQAVNIHTVKISDTDSVLCEYLSKSACTLASEYLKANKDDGGLAKQRTEACLQMFNTLVKNNQIPEYQLYKEQILEAVKDCSKVTVEPEEKNEKIIKYAGLQRTRHYKGHKDDS